MKKILFAFLFLLVPSFLYATESKIIYKKNLGDGFRIVQTESTISLYYKTKNIESWNNIDVLDLSCLGDVAFDSKEYQEIKGKLDEIEGDLSTSGRLEALKKSGYYTNTSSTIQLAVRECWKDLSITKLKHNWIQVPSISYPGGPARCYINSKTSLYTCLDGLRFPIAHAEAGRSGLYILVEDIWGGSRKWELYLVKEDGTMIRQYEGKRDLNQNASFELLLNKKIKIIFSKSLGWNRKTQKRDYEYTSMIIPVTLNQ